MLLISDANILIDIEVGNLTDFIFLLAHEVAIDDLVFEFELKERHHHLLKAGLQVRSLTSESVKKTAELCSKYPKASIMDHSTLALEIQEKGILLTGDKHLCEAAVKEGVPVHGTIWIIEELLNQKIIQNNQARNSFDAMKAKGSRLPWKVVEDILNKRETIL